MISNKLVESWLDNQGEKRYQPALIQLMISEGWEVLHNTRHGILEYGKDVIARSPEGRLCALQLKGNPGSRLSKSQAQKMVDQITEAIEVEIPESYGRKPLEKHLTILVTNGEIDEEARELFDRVGKRTRRDLCPSDGLEYWTRGTLLQRFNSKVDQVWPTTVKGISLAIKMFGSEGLDAPNPIEFVTPLRSSFPEVSARLKAPAKNSAITGIFLLAEIMKSPWYKTRDHYSLFVATVLAATYALQFADTKKRKGLVKSYASLALQHATTLYEECLETDYDPKSNWAVRSPLDERDVMGERARLVADALSALVLAEAAEQTERTEFRRLIGGSFHKRSLWGQFPIPSILVRYLAFRTVDATQEPDQVLRGALHGAITVAQQHRLPNVITNASPYYSYSEVLYAHTAGKLGIESGIRQDEVQKRAWFVQILMYMLAKRNWKQTCKQVWRAFSNLLHENADIPLPHFLSPNHSDEGTVLTEVFERADWSEFVSDAVAAGKSEKFQQFEGIEWLAAAYITIVPYRAELRFVMALDTHFGRTWYNEGHLPGLP